MNPPQVDPGKRRTQMPELSLTDQEQALLLELLDGTYRDLKMEISNTDTSTFKDQLKEREHLLENLIAKVSAR